ncbi:hypothetical protein JNK13_04610 [bacterium]|nr:hypothetical protein [bacterium]
MAIKFRLKGLAETFIDTLKCPCCGCVASENGDQQFRTDLSKVTTVGIVVVVQCLKCSEIFVPGNQRRGIVNSKELHTAVEVDCKRTGEKVITSVDAVVAEAERLNAQRHNQVH